MKTIEDREHEIAALKEQMKAYEIDESSKVVLQENQTQQSIFITSMLVQQLQDMITRSIRAQYGGLS